MANINGTASVSSSLTTGGVGHKDTSGTAAVTGRSSVVVTYAPRRLPYVDGVWRTYEIATKPGGVSAPKVVFIPEGVKDFTLYVIGNAANTCRVAKSIDSAATIRTGVPTWLSVDGTLESVGTTMVRYVLGNTLPMALRIECLVNDKTAKMVVLGKRI